MMVLRPAVFLDRDGVINREYGYVHKVDEFHFVDGVFAACREISRLGYRLIVITNQAGIARGYYTEDDFHQLTKWMLGEFSRHDVGIDDVYYCPHHPVYGVGKYHRDCGCRKPAPGMIVRAAREHMLDLQHSILVGDKVTDVEAGQNAGLSCCALVRTGHPVSNEDMDKADAVFDNLPEMSSALANKRLCADSNGLAGT